METKFKVYCEFEFEGKIEKSMESPASWFLLTQTGKLYEYGPTTPPKPVEKIYKKAIPLFYTGYKDQNDVEIYEGDIYCLPNKFSDEIFVIKNFIEDTYWLIDAIRNGYKPKVIGNFYLNPELLKEE